MEKPQNHKPHDSRDNASMRVARLEGFTAPRTLPPDEQEAYNRRFSTIFIDENRCREGGLGQVFYGEDTWGKPVAVKTMGIEDARTVSSAPSDDAASSPTHDITNVAFRREYETLRTLSGVRGFPRLYGSGRLDDKNAIVMEWIEGETLATAIRHLSIDDENRLSPLTVAQLGRDLFALLARMEILEDGIVHRDISTSNIMIDTSTRTLDEQVESGSFDLKLVDFGSAVLPARSSSLTQRYGMPRGATPDFAPPEMLTEDIANVSTMRKSSAVDVYAAASVLYLLLSGHTPFDLGKNEEGERSYYLAKTERLPRGLRGAHAASTAIDITLEHEPQTAKLVRKAAQRIGEQPTERKVAAALSAVDGQLNDVILACLDSIQEYRPRATEVQEALGQFVEAYDENIENALAEKPLSPCASNAFERRARVASARRSRRWDIGVGIGAAILLFAVSFVTAGLVDSNEATVALGPIRWTGVLSGLAIAALLWLPAITGGIARIATRGRASALPWTGGGVGVGTLLVLAFVLGTAFATPATFWLLLCALAVSATLSWGALSFGIIIEEARMMPTKKTRVSVAS